MMRVVEKIGIFDSGMGGLSVLKSLINEIDFKEIIYYGDTARVPYGNKDHNTIVRFSLEALNFFNSFDIDMLVVACNTVSAHAIEYMKEKSNFPIVGVIESGILALENKGISKNSEILVIATNATIKSNSYNAKLKELGYARVTNIATNLLVSLVEENILHGDIVKSTFEYYFKNLKPDALILGCTHFPFLLESLKEFFGKNTIFIHSGEAIANYLLNNFSVKRLDSKHDIHDRIKFFASDDVEKLRNNAALWLHI